MSNFNNAVYGSRGTERVVVGYRCDECGDVAQTMWGTTCNKCRTAERRHQESLAAQTQITSRISVQDLTKMREAILTILDDGDPINAPEYNPWEFYVGPVPQEVANVNRIRFCNAVSDYILKDIKSQVGDVVGEKAARAF